MKFRIQAPCQAGTNPQARSYRLAIFSTTGVVLGLLAVTAALHPGLSQGVQLVKVDIEVVSTAIA